MQKLKHKVSKLTRDWKNADNLDGASVIELLRNEVLSFPSVAESDDAFSKCFDNFGNCKVLLIGDGSHGTSEFYKARADITKYMIERHGFNIVAVEADWPDAEAVDRYARHRPGPGLKASIEPDAQKMDKDRVFEHFPTWMWRNREVHNLVEWLQDYNQNKDVSEPESVGFYGMDLYSLESSIRAVIDYLEKVDEDMANLAKERYSELMVWAENPEEYGLETVTSDFKGYEAEVVDMLKDLLNKRLEYSATLEDGIEFHGGEQNARVVKGSIPASLNNVHKMIPNLVWKVLMNMNLPFTDAEQYYKMLYYGHRESWNLRDTHMFETLIRILKHRGESCKAIVWAHNSHVGDARASSKGWIRKELNVAQLCKEKLGTRALAIGCCTYQGKVAATDQWNNDMQIMEVKPALPESYEQLMHSTGIKNFVLDLRKSRCSKRLREALKEERLQRFIGIVYRPDSERQSHYSFTILPEQYDGFIWFDETNPVGTFEISQPPTAIKSDENSPSNF